MLFGLACGFRGLVGVCGLWLSVCVVVGRLLVLCVSCVLLLFVMWWFRFEFCFGLLMVVGVLVLGSFGFCVWWVGCVVLFGCSWLLRSGGWCNIVPASDSGVSVLGWHVRWFCGF